MGYWYHRVTENSSTASAVIQLPESASQHRVCLQNSSLPLLRKFEICCRNWSFNALFSILFVSSLYESWGPHRPWDLTVGCLRPSFSWNLHHDGNIKSRMVNIYGRFLGAVCLHLERQTVPPPPKKSPFFLGCLKLKAWRCGPSKRR
jgi:hypothetical protein